MRCGKPPNATGCLSVGPIALRHTLSRALPNVLNCLFYCAKKDRRFFSFFSLANRFLFVKGLIQFF